MKRRAPAPPCPADDDAKLFRAAVADARPLRPDGRVAPPRPTPEVLPRRRPDPDEEARAAALSDEIDVGPDFRRPGIGPDVLRRLGRGHWPVRAEIDLHGMRRDAARDALAGFVDESVALGLRCVRVVHGKGLSSPGGEPVLKPRVRAWLAQMDMVLAFCPSRPGDGGALVVLLQSGAR